MFPNLLRREWLPNVATRARGQGLDDVRLTAFGCNHDHWDVFCVRHARKLLDEFQSVHDRHVDIAKDQIDLILLKDNQCLRPVSGFQDRSQIDARLA